MTKSFTRSVTVFTVALLMGMAPAAAPAAEGGDQGVIEDVLGILRERGIVDDEQYAELVTRNASYEKEEESLFGRIEWFGDLRLRHESFWFDRNPDGSESPNRFRGRYRFRLGGKVPINEWISANFRIASGEGSAVRSTNRSLGRDDDFGADDLNIDRAFLELRPFEDRLGDASLKLIGGKVPNPFTWKKGKDFLLWDGDINPEGVGLKYRVAVNEDLSVFANAGYMIIDENSSSKDPHVFGAQIGAEGDLSRDVSLGGRVSWYNFRSLNSAFVTRGSMNGNVVGGLTDSDGQIKAGELYAYLGFSGIEDWPILLYGTYVENFSARSTATVGKEDSAWGVGIEAGDKKRYARLGVGYWEAESNFWPSQFTDSDLFDGTTNREGWMIYGARQIARNTDLKFQLFLSDDLEDGAGFLVDDADRIRLQTDLVVKF